MMRHTRCALPLVLLGSSLAGCARTSDVVTAKGEILAHNDQQTIELTRQHLTLVMGDVEELRGSLVDVERRARANADRLEEERRAALDRERRIGERIGAIMTAMTRSFGASFGGPGGAVVAGAVGDAIRAGIDTAVDRSSDESIRRIADTEERVGVRVTRVGDRVQENAQSVREVRSTLIEIESRLAKLPIETQGEILALRGAVDQEIARISVLSDPKEMDRQLDRMLLARGLTEAEIGKLRESYSTLELLLLVGGGSILGAGGGGVASKLGKSRSQAAIDRLSEKLEALEVKKM